MVDTFRQVEPPDWPIQFSVVELGPLGAEDNRKRYSIGIVPGPERYAHNFPLIVRFLRVAIEFRVTVNRGDPAPGNLAEQVLSVIEHVVLANTKWGGLAIDTGLQNNETDMTTYEDRTVVGVLWVEVQYRHHHADPHNPNPSP
ncbi:MAG: hypothetical protein KJZ83_00350 [Burkholderiaceae bacterium]|nr:hypothetical protein [Burkholderiaceae bacterium]